MSEAANFFPPKAPFAPKIYAYSDSHSQYKGLLKVGYTMRDAQARIAEQYGNLLRPGAPTYKIELIEAAMREDGTAFTDHEIHRRLERMGCRRRQGEWFACSAENVRAAIIAEREGRGDFTDERRDWDFAMRPEQRAAVEKTAAYFHARLSENGDATPHFLWNAKMRFGKTFAAYKLAQAMGWKRLLVLTFKPAVQNAWQEDLLRHVDFAGWRFIGKEQSAGGAPDKEQPFVCFGSFQDFMGKNKAGGIKAKNQWVHEINWDCVILDEYHYGAWREGAKELFADESAAEQRFAEGEGLDFYEEGNMPITASAYLYLSGTPFRALADGEFIEEQIYNWTYSDEQRAKENWDKAQGENPYAALPRMIMLTYTLPDIIRHIAEKGEFNEFDLNEFFKAEGSGKTAKFKYQDEVQKWLDLIRGNFSPAISDNLKLGDKKPPLPFSDKRLLALLPHTFWFLPNVAACDAMGNLLRQRQNSFYHDYKIIIAAGAKAGIGAEALKPVERAFGNPLETKTITLSCGKLTTGVSVRPWSGIFMLRSMKSPETYFQAAFRVQTPWTLKNPDGLSPDKTEILKQNCYVFDFAPNRALKQVADYSCRLNIDESDPQKKVAEFIHFLPILAYDGSSMRQINAAGVLDMAMSGTTATLLARRWESALLVNVDNTILARLKQDQELLEALQNIEGFRRLNEDIETLINKAEAIKKTKQEANDRDLSLEEKRELSREEKEYKSLRKQLQENLIKFAARVPVFMYLTDYREQCLKDVIMQLEPNLFKKVTGLEIADFEKMLHMGVFNSAVMNEAVFSFKRYEDSSLHYIEARAQRHKGLVGLFDTQINAREIFGEE